MPSKPKIFKPMGTMTRAERDKDYNQRHADDPARKLRSSARYQRFRKWAIRRYPLCCDPFHYHRDDGGAVAADDLHHVQSVSVDLQRERHYAGPRPINNGSRMIGGGVALLIIGFPAALSGGVLMWILPFGNLFMNMPLLVVGGGMLAGGSALVSVGRERRKLYRMMLQRQHLSRITSLGGEPLTVPWSYRLRF